MIVMTQASKQTCKYPSVFFIGALKQLTQKCVYCTRNGKVVCHLTKISKKILSIKLK